MAEENSGTTIAVSNGKINGADIALNHGNGNTYLGAVSSDSNGPVNVVKTGNGTTNLNGINAYTGATTISAGSLIAQSNAPSMATSGFDGSGALVIQPAGNAFTSAFTLPNWTLASTLGGPNIGKAAASANGTSYVTGTFHCPISIAGATGV